MGRADSLVRLAWAYGLHQTRRRVKRAQAQLPALVETYAPDGIRPLTLEEYEEHPRLVGCINCGMCAFASYRMGAVRLPDLASSYMRLYSRIGEAASDLTEDGTAATSADLGAASAVCPVGVPLEEVAAVVRRLTRG